MPKACIFSSPQFYGSAIIAAVGWSVGYFSARRVAAATARSLAAANLRAAFSPTLSKIRYQKLTFWNDIRPVAQSTFDVHAVEFEKFRFYVSDIPAYDAACSEYCNLVHSRSITAATTPREAIPDKTTNAERYVRAVKAILHFANP
jgi:hypothetical protein